MDLLCLLSSHFRKVGWLLWEQVRVNIEDNTEKVSDDKVSAIFQCNQRQKAMRFTFLKSLTLSWGRPISYGNQSIVLQSKSTDWFLYDFGLRHERVKKVFQRLKCLKFWKVLSKELFWQGWTILCCWSLSISPENLWFCDAFKGYGKSPFAWNGSKFDRTTNTDYPKNMIQPSR